MDNKINWQDIIILILFIISIAVVLWYFFGNSPTLLESLVILMLTLMFLTNVQVIKNSMRLNFLEKNIKDSFNNMERDINLIKDKLGV